MAPRRAVLHALGHARGLVPDNVTAEYPAVVCSANAIARACRGGSWRECLVKCRGLPLPAALCVGPLRCGPACVWLSLAMCPLCVAVTHVQKKSSHRDSAPATPPGTPAPSPPRRRQAISSSPSWASTRVAPQRGHGGAVVSERPPLLAPIDGRRPLQMAHRHLTIWSHAASPPCHVPVP